MQEAAHFGMKQGLAEPEQNRPFQRHLLFAILLVYGAIAGLRTVADFDLGWQMAEARHALTSVDTLSYTAQGARWIYPPLAGHIFEWLFHIAGYSAISWFCAGAVVLTLAMLAAGNSLPTILLSFVAVPLIAGQMIPRSGLFTIVIAAAFTRLLLAWHLHADRRCLSPLPVLMMLWVNLHTGFIAGIGLMLGYIAVEVAALFSNSTRTAALSRLRRAAPWLAATLGSTLINPWGARMYSAIAAQEHVSKLQVAIVEELQPLYHDFSWSALNPLYPLSAVWYLLIFSALAIVLLVRQHRTGLAVFLSCAVIACLLSGRSQGVFASVACLMGGEAFSYAPRTKEYESRFKRLKPGASGLFAIALAALVTWRAAAIISDRTSLQEEQITLFGAGASWWLPQEAGSFIEKNHLPTELFSTFNLSSYLTWLLAIRSLHSSCDSPLSRLTHRNGDTPPPGITSEPSSFPFQDSSEQPACLYH
jgi:hypothetical protein